MDFILIPLVALIASLLTFFSGFGLGTLLMPVFAIFFSIDIAVALTAIVHFLNNIFKLALVGRHAHRDIVFKFGIPAILSAFVGAWILVRLSDLPPITTYVLGNREFHVLWIKVIVACLMVGFTLFELLPSLRNIEFEKKFLPLGGVLSGFFGGLSGHQGALRSAFLARLKLSKESFIGTGVVIACLIDLARIGVYTKHLTTDGIANNLALLSVSILAAFIGAYFGNKFLRKITMEAIQTIIAVMLLLLSAALGSGLI